jgi:DNA-binding IclR family transcriptional regulator
MADFKPKPGSFTPYLEYAQRDRIAPERAAASPLTLLEILGRRDDAAMPLSDLQTLSAMDPARYRDALKSLRDAGYIEVEGPALDETVRLTGKGAEVARLARSA